MSAIHCTVQRANLYPAVHLACTVVFVLAEAQADLGLLTIDTDCLILLSLVMNKVVYIRPIIIIPYDVALQIMRIFYTASAAFGLVVGGSGAK